MKACPSHRWLKYGLGMVLLVGAAALHAATIGPVLLEQASPPALQQAQPALGTKVRPVLPNQLAVPTPAQATVVKPVAGPGIQSPSVLLQPDTTIHDVPTINVRMKDPTMRFDDKSTATAIGKQTSSAIVKMLPHTPAVPGNLRNASGAQDCAAHLGLIGALVCPDLIRSGHLLLVWDWQSGSGPDQIDGYRIYRVDGKKQLLYTRTDKNNLTLFDVPLPAGGYVGTCYAVTAYTQTFESALSPVYCPTRLQTMVGATPTVKPPAPKPRAPNHVDIHVGDDSYPNDTIVAAGGSVTWINDDTDSHTVYGPAGAFVGELEPSGGRHTETFRDIGRGDYVVHYICEYHENMRGTITVQVNP